MKKTARKRLTPTQLDALAKIDVNDIDKAKKAWREDAPRKHRALLDTPKVKRGT